MILYQSLRTYNKIEVYPHEVLQRLMMGDSTELEGLYSLNPQAITEIHNRYYPDIYRFARYRVSDEIIAEDIAGDVFMRLLESVHNGHGPSTNLRGWLFRTTANIVNDHFRKIYTHPKEDSSELHENSRDLYTTEDDPSVITDQAERRQTVHQALEKLTDAQKLVITLRFGNRLSLEDTAKIMGKNANTIKALQFRALVSMRKNIGSDLL